MGIARNRLGVVAACLLIAIPVNHLAATLLDGGPSAPAVSRLRSPAPPANQLAATPRGDSSILCGLRGGRSNNSCALGPAEVDAQVAIAPSLAHFTRFGIGARPESSGGQHERGPPDTAALAIR
jgi:hypothetical protein